MKREIELFKIVKLLADCEIMSGKFLTERNVSIVEIYCQICDTVYMSLIQSEIKVQNWVKHVKNSNLVQADHF